MNLEKSIYDHYDELNESEKLVVHFILDNEDKVKKMSISELAKKCLVSQSSIFRLTKKLGLSGFSQLKFILSESKLKMKKQESNYLESMQVQIDHVIQQFKLTNFTHVYQILEKAIHIYIYTTGWEQTIIAEHLRRNMFSVGKNAIVLPSASDELHALSERITNDDVLIIISYNGANESLINSIKYLSLSKNIETIAITTLKQNKLAEVCRNSIYYSVIEAGPKYIYFGSMYVLGDLLTMGFHEFTLKD